jgi:hypothetical protein
MKAKTRVKEETLPAVRLFRNNLDDLTRLFKEHASGVTISDNQYFYNDLAEMRDKIGPRLRYLQIGASNPTATLSFVPSVGVKLNVTSTGDDDSEENKNANVLFLRAKDYLGDHRTSTARFMSPGVTAVVVGIGAIAMGLSILTSPVVGNAFSLDARHAALFGAGLLVLMLTVVSAIRMSTYYFVYYGYPAELNSFWKRKKDDLILVVIGGVLGGLITVILQLVVGHFQKK